MEKQCLIFLPSIDPEEISKLLNKGFFNRPIPIKSKLTISSDSKFNKTYSSDSKELVFTTHNLIMATVGNKKDSNNLNRCDACKCDFETSPFGIPISYHRENILNEKNVNRIHHFFLINNMDEFCSLECAYYYMNKNSIKTELLIILHKLMFPDSIEPLLPINDPRLLQSNGGSLTFEEWKNKKYSYFHSGSNRALIYFITAREELIQGQRI
jgi:hypothetical protein